MLFRRGLSGESRKPHDESQVYQGHLDLVLNKFIFLREISA